jgi:hypothetical protein
MDNHSNSIVSAAVGGKTVQDLIVRYKEVSSWIKKLIQSQPSADKRLAIILSAIRCAITCWNMGNFNSSREIWLGLKTALINQNDDYPGMSFLNSAFDSSTFVTNHQNVAWQAQQLDRFASKSTRQSLAQTALNTTTIFASKKSYCSKTAIYCEAISRALDTKTCKVVPFFGAFLHDLRFIVENVPSITVMCNKNVQKPIEVSLLI